MPEGPKIGYHDWQRFRENLVRLRSRHSWSQISDLFDHTQNGGPGWAERANEHRSLVSERDMSRARELVLELEEQETVDAADQKIQEEIQTRLHALREQAGSWVAATEALGKNPKSSGHYTRVAAGKTRGSKKLLSLLRDVERRGPIPARRRKVDYPERGGPVTAEESREIQTRLHALHARLKTWKAVGEAVRGKASMGGYLSKLADGKRGGSKALLHRLREIEVREPQPVPTPPQPQPEPAPVPLAEPWPLRAQTHLRAALEIIEQGTAQLPKAMRGATADVVTQVKLAIDELEI